MSRLLQRSVLVGAITLVCALTMTTTIAHAADSLPSWNDGPPRSLWSNSWRR